MKWFRKYIVHAGFQRAEHGEELGELGGRNKGRIGVVQVVPQQLLVLQMNNKHGNNQIKKRGRVRLAKLFEGCGFPSISLLGSRRQRAAQSQRAS